MHSVTTRIRLVLSGAAATLVLLAACTSDPTAAPASPTEPAVTSTEPDTTAPAASSGSTTPDSTTSESSTTVAGDAPAAFPAVTVDPGTYRVDEFVVPYEITVAGTWTRYANTEKMLMIGRGTNAATEFTVSSGVAHGATALEALASICPDAAWGPAAEVQVLGQPGVEHEATLTADCLIGEFTPGTSQAVLAGNTIHLAAVEVDGAVVVVISDAPSAEWATVSPDVIAMQASLTPAA